MANNLDRELPATDMDPLAFMGSPIVSSFYLHPASVYEISHLIDNLKITKEGRDSLPVEIFKKCSLFFAPLICDMVNLSFSSGKFPHCLKVAHIIPIFKAGNSSLVENYRPIALLPLISKIFERAIFNPWMHDHFLLHLCIMGSISTPNFFYPNKTHFDNETTI